MRLAGPQCYIYYFGLQDIAIKDPDLLRTAFTVTHDIPHVLGPPVPKVTCTLLVTCKVFGTDQREEHTIATPLF